MEDWHEHNIQILLLWTSVLFSLVYKEGLDAQRQ